MIRLAPLLARLTFAAFRDARPRRQVVDWSKGPR